MRFIFIDLETYSNVDLETYGVYRYSEDDGFEILLFAVSVDGGEVTVYDLANGEKVPEDIINAIKDPSIKKYAFNANFERICLSRYIGLPKSEFLAPESWRCTMVHAAYLGLPHSLEKVSEVLRLSKPKLDGKKYIKTFSVPQKPTKKNGFKTRIIPAEAPDEWAQFKSYNKRDVETELEIERRISRYPVPQEVWEEYFIDQRINDRGILIDKNLVNGALQINAPCEKELFDELVKRTGLENPNSLTQLKGWLKSKGIDAPKLGKEEINALIPTVPADIAQVLKLRLKASKSSVKKYTTMTSMRCEDGRARGCFKFYGAKTGRWSGKHIQLQNLPRLDIDNIDVERAIVSTGDYDFAKMLCDFEYKDKHGKLQKSDVPDTLSQLIRTAIIAKPGYKLFASDFSAIEARVLAWLANEEWRMKVFADGGDIYCASASEMFHVEVTKTNENHHLRQRGKVAELSCGYGGGPDALKSMLEKMGAAGSVPDDELEVLVHTWRKANPNIVGFWWAVGRAAIDAIRYKATTEINGIKFDGLKGILFVTLPSGRKLSYLNPRIKVNKNGSSYIEFDGIDEKKKWGTIKTYGPKLVENITQAISRDVLCYAMKNLKDYEICMHIHDEVVIEAPEGTSLSEINKTMSRVPPWAEGLQLNAAGFESYYYKKE